MSSGFSSNFSGPPGVDLLTNSFARILAAREEHARGSPSRRNRTPRRRRRRKTPTDRHRRFEARRRRFFMQDRNVAERLLRPSSARRARRTEAPRRAPCRESGGAAPTRDAQPADLVKNEPRHHGASMTSERRNAITSSRSGLSSAR